MSSEASVPPAEIPEQIGPYAVDALIGSGGMGNVYHGKHRETGLEAAIKVLPASMAREPGFVARFNREIDAMRQLDSPNIVKLFDSGEDRGTYYYAMEYVAGENLADRLRREKRISWRETIDIAVQVCRALKAAHNSGIIHRDIKPSNLILNNSGAVKLADFGVAQVFATSRLTVTGGVIGTAEYMSPEQAVGRRAGKQSDIYSLGAVMYVMLTGRPPFVGRTTLEVAQKHKFGQFDSPRCIVPETPRWLDEVVCKCLAKTAEERFPDAYVLQLRLQEIPKKVDLAQSGSVSTAGGGATSEAILDVDGAAGHAITEASEHAGGDQIEPGGTLMRDLIRAHADPKANQTPIERVFDNFWVLLAMLIFLVVSSWWFFKTRTPTSEELFAKGEMLMRHPAGSDWDVAKRECFEPLMSHEKKRLVWEGQVEPYLRRIAFYEWKKEFLGRRMTRGERIPQSDPERFFKRALQQQRMGETMAARQTLESLKLLLKDLPDYREVLKFVDDLLDELPQPEIRVRTDVAKLAMSRAEDLVNEGKVDEARKTWQALLFLYEQDPTGQALSERIRVRLADTANWNPKPNDPPIEPELTAP